MKFISHAKFLSFFIIMGLVLSCSGNKKKGVPVVVEKVCVKETSPMVTVSGKLIPSEMAEISIPYEAVIGEIYVREGSLVHREEPLFRISEDVLTKKLRLSNARRNELQLLIEKNTTLLRSREVLLEEGKIEKDELLRLEKEIALNEAELERVRAEIEMDSYNIEHALIVSPMSGMVTEIKFNIGQVVKPNTVLIKISNTNPIIVSFAMNAFQSQDVRLEMPIEIYVNELPDQKFSGKVAFINPELHRVGSTFDVWVSVSNDDLKLKAGMRASTDFESEKIHYTYIVPLSSVISRSSSPFVYRVSKGLVHKTSIVIGSILGNQVEVVRGLSKGDIVVADGAKDLFDGAEVSIWYR